MIAETVDIIGTAILFVAPFVLALIVIVLVVAYPWVVLTPGEIWWGRDYKWRLPLTKPASYCVM